MFFLLNPGLTCNIYFNFVRVKKEARDSPDQYHRQAGTDQTEDSVRPKTPKEEKLKKSDR